MKPRLRILAMAALAAPLLAIGIRMATSAEPAFDPTGKYELVQPPQATETPGKVEVVDVFWYGCPHCFDFLPVMERYQASKPDYVEIRRMPAIFRDNWIAHARAYYTAKLLGIDDKIHRPLFDAIHVKNRSLDNREDLMKFFADFGVSSESFNNTWDSFAAESLMRKSNVMQMRYGGGATNTVALFSAPDPAAANQFVDELQASEAFQEFAEKVAGIRTINNVSIYRRIKTWGD